MATSEPDFKSNDLVFPIGMNPSSFRVEIRQTHPLCLLCTSWYCFNDTDLFAESYTPSHFNEVLFFSMQ